MLVKGFIQGTSPQDFDNDHDNLDYHNYFNDFLYFRISQDKVRQSEAYTNGYLNLRVNKYIGVVSSGSDVLVILG